MKKLFVLFLLLAGCGTSIDPRPPNNADTIHVYIDWGAYVGGSLSPEVIAETYYPNYRAVSLKILQPAWETKEAKFEVTLVKK